MGVVTKMYVKNKIFIFTKFLNLKLFSYFYKLHHDIYVINILIRMLNHENSIFFVQIRLLHIFFQKKFFPIFFNFIYFMSIMPYKL